MPICKSLNSRILTVLAYVVGISGILTFGTLFGLYLVVLKTLNSGLFIGINNFHVLHCIFMIITSFLEVIASIFLVIGVIKRSDQEVGMWIMMNILCTIFILLAVLPLYTLNKDETNFYLDIEHLPLMIPAFIFYGIGFDIIYSYYVYIHDNPYNILQE